MNDELARLAEANPVRIEDLDDSALPGFGPRSSPGRRLVTAVVLASVVAALLLGVVLFGISPHSQRGSTIGTADGPTGIQTMAQAIKAPIGGGKRVTLANAAAAIDAPVVLPNTSLVRPADAGPVWAWSNGADGLVVVTYPGKVLVIRYQRPFVGGDPLSTFTSVSKEIPSSHLIRLGGVPALAIPPNPDYHQIHFGRILFESNNLEIEVWGNYDEATLQSVAQSIVDRSGDSSSVLDSAMPLATVARPLPQPTAKEVSLDDASAALGEAIVLPDTSFVGPSDLGSVWVDGTGTPADTAAAVTFPSQGIFIVYRGGYTYSDSGYRAIAAQDLRSFQTISLNGRTALAVKQNSDQTGHNFGGVIFALKGLEIRVFGHYGEAKLLPIAQSIIDRSR